MASKAPWRMVAFSGTLLSCCVVSSAAAENARVVAGSAFPSVVLLVIQDANGQPLSLGSGFFVHQGVVATNLHVMQGSSRGYAKLVGQKAKYNITGIVGIDRKMDLILLGVKGVNAPPLPLGDSARVEVGDQVFVIGNPMGLEGSLSRGIVSGVRQIGAEKVLQITAPMSPGSSGGPVLNTQGKVIGVAVATFKDGQNLNFAIPSSYLQSLLSRLGPIAAGSPASTQRDGIERRESVNADRTRDRESSKGRVDERIEPEAPQISAEPAAQSRPSLTVYILKDGRRINAKLATGAGDELVITDEKGELHKVKKSEIAEIFHKGGQKPPSSKKKPAPVGTQPSPVGRSAPRACETCGGAGWVTCSYCNGKGYTICKSCNGQGVIKSRRRLGTGGYRTFTKICRRCKGTGIRECPLCTRLPANKPRSVTRTVTAIWACTRCGGSGLVTGTRGGIYRRICPACDGTGGFTMPTLKKISIRASGLRRCRKCNKDGHIPFPAAKLSESERKPETKTVVVPWPPPVAKTGGLEEAFVVKDFNGRKVLVQRASGEKWILEAKTWCIWSWRYEGRKVLLKFGYVSSKLINEDGDVCEFWTRESLD